MNKAATVLLFVNFVTVLFPQPGYIHPDEFFQSTEIVAGDVLGVSHARPWEFNSSFPIRNLVFPYLLTGPSLHLLRWMNSTSIMGMRISAVKIVMATRLPMAFVSLFGFSAIGQLCERFKVDKYLSQVIWSSSYVAWIYFTRTFSNSTEAFLLALFLLVSLKSLPEIKLKISPPKRKSTDGLKRNESSLESKKKISGKAVDSDNGSQAEKVQHHDSNSYGGTAFLLGFILMAGFFNRPTFLFFGVVPLCYWLVNIGANAKSCFQRWLFASFMCVFGMAMSFSIFTVADSFYYNENFMNLIFESGHRIVENKFSLDAILEVIDKTKSALVITPWNFIKYNMNSANLAEHGLHPPYMHFAVNLPLLLGPFFFLVIAACILSVVQLLQRKTSGSRDLFWLVLMALVPIAGLSLFPHQEPRFLIPILPILVVLGTKLLSHMVMGKKLFIIMWVLYNLTLNLFYGYLHQAAIIPALSIYQQKLSSPKTVGKLMASGTSHAFFYKTYPPPLHLLLLDPDQEFFQVHDLAGLPVKDLVKKVRSVQKQQWATPKGKGQIFVFLPATSASRVTDLLSSDLQEFHSEISTTSICPHFSAESLPRFKQFWAKRLSFDDFLMDFCLDVLRIA